MANMTNFSPASDAGNVKTEASPSGPATSGLALAGNGNGNAPTSKPKSKPRKRVNTAEKRNQHNAIERARRETLNGKFISLARLLPSLASVRRPSKSAIVNGSISHLTHQRDQRLLAARLLRSLCAERDALVKECNEWRYANGLPARDDVSSWSDEVEEVCNVEKEQFGTFSGMFEGGDDGDNENENEDGDGEDDGVNHGDMSNSFSMPMFGNQQQHQHQPTSYGVGEMTIEQAAAIAAQASFGPNGLLTPRTSTDMSMSGSGFLSASWAQQNFGSNQAANNNGNVNSFIPSSLSSSTASLPFNAFMSNDSNSDSPASNPGSGFSHMATPPTTGFLNGLPSAMQHTPSPSSSHSFEDGVPAASGNNVNANAAPQWTEQQLLLLRALQHQQHLRQRQNLSTLQMQQLQVLQNLNPLTLGLGLNGNGQGNVGGNANGLGGHSAFSTGNGNVNGLASSPTGTDSPFNLFNSVNMQHGASQFNQAMFNNANGPSPTSAGLGSNANGNNMVPPPLSRAQTENLEAWRKMSAMPNNFRTNVPLGLTFEQLQQARSVEGF